MTSCRDDIETFSRLDKALIDLLLASAKDPATSAKNIWRKARARNRVPQRERAQAQRRSALLSRLDVIRQKFRH